MHALVHAAGIQDREGGALPMAALFGACPFLPRPQAGGGCAGPQFQAGLRHAMRGAEGEIVKRPDTAQGFAVLPRRWAAGRTIAWLNRCRRWAKDWECLSRRAPAFLRLASIRLMRRKPCQARK